MIIDVALPDVTWAADAVHVLVDVADHHEPGTELEPGEHVVAHVASVGRRAADTRLASLLEAEDTREVLERGVLVAVGEPRVHPRAVVEHLGLLVSGDRRHESLLVRREDVGVYQLFAGDGREFAQLRARPVDA